MICSNKLFAGTSHHEQKMQHYDHDKPEETCEHLTEIIPSIFDLAPCIMATSLNHHMSSGWHCAGPRRGGSRRPDGQTPTNFFPLLKSQISKSHKTKGEVFGDKKMKTTTLQVHMFHFISWKWSNFAQEVIRSERWNFTDFYGTLNPLTYKDNYPSFHNHGKK